SRRSQALAFAILTAARPVRWAREARGNAREVRMTLDLAYALDTFGLLMCALLVMLMQPGFALLEAGLHSAKNLVNILMKNFADFAVAGLAFWAFGFALMYGGGPFLAGYEPALNAPVAMD